MQRYTIILAKNTDICQTIDPFGSSYYRKHTRNFTKSQKTYSRNRKVGGMSKAIEKGIPKLKIEAAAIKRQANIDNANNLIIGLNCFKDNKNESIEIQKLIMI